MKEVGYKVAKQFGYFFRNNCANAVIFKLAELRANVVLVVEHAVDRHASG